MLPLDLNDRKELSTELEAIDMVLDGVVVGVAVVAMDISLSSSSSSSPCCCGLMLLWPLLSLKPGVTAKNAQDRHTKTVKKFVRS